MIENRQFRITREEIAQAGSLSEAFERLLDPHHLLRWYVASADEKGLVIEATLTSDPLRQIEKIESQPFTDRSVVVSLIPTGVGCEIGGYAGDAAPVSSLLAGTADYLVTNPNAVNASNFIHLEPNVLYTEGSVIDLFCRGDVSLHLPYSNRVGLIIEACPPDQLDQILNIVNTVRAVHGVDLAGYVVTKEPIGSRCTRNVSGAYVGTVDNPGELFRATERLLSMGANAIAITSNIQDLPQEEYVRHFEGKDANPMGGVEAVMSHLITNKFQVPAAHGPLINNKNLALVHRVVDARGAGEMASISGLACVLLGLRRAPQFIYDRRQRFFDSVNITNTLAIVAPADCLGGVPVIYAERFGIPVIAVRENRTLLRVSAEDLGLPNVRHVANYAEAAGLIVALRRGISLDSVTRPLQTLRTIKQTFSASAPSGLEKSVLVAGASWGER